MRYSEFQDLDTQRLVLRRITMQDVPQYFGRLFGCAKVAEFMLWKLCPNDPGEVQKERDQT